ncbi:MAG: hypothetical protein COA91_02360 [Robiginitomaculum sp.]|nr:MAG: hypothetical protein COA91_02360 [Robiginitomaculum sp.]
MRKITMFSWACLLLVFGMAFYTWMGLPELEQYPVHWNADGVPDRYGSKGEVLFNLLIMPLTTAFTFAVFAFIPKIEPVQASVDANRRPYTYIWGLLMVLFVGISGLISYSYINVEAEPEISTLPISFIVIAMSAFFIFIGNIMGKFKRNFLVGIRTPWTLSSDLAWDKTHRLGGRMFVGAGLLSLVSAFITKPEIALMILVGFVLAIAIFSFVYSFLVWKNDPDKRT